MRTYHYNIILLYCCGLQIRPVEEQLKQRVIGERYCIRRKKEVIQKKYCQFSACSLSVKCLVRNEKLSSPNELARRICLRWTSQSLGYGRICPHNIY